MAVEVFIHKMTEHMDRAVILGWRVREGETVSQYQVLMDVETEKATVELEAPAAGVLKGVRPGAVAGAEVPVGEPLAFIAAPGEDVPLLPPLGQAEAAAGPAPAQLPAAQAGGPDGAAPEEGAIRATPIARRLAKDLRVDLAQVKGSGPRGRVREEDVRAYAAALQAAPGPVPRQAEAPMPAPIRAPAAPDDQADWLELSAAQRLTGRRMLESVQTAPQLSLELSVDVSNLLWLRETQGGADKISVTAFLVQAAGSALKRHPRVNASFQEGRLRLSRRADVCVAVGTENGLFAPVIFDADQKRAGQIQREIQGFQEKAAGRGFSPAELEGGTFTVTNLGMYGIERFNAILNPPQGAILAVGKIVKTPVGLPDDTVALRPLLRLTLTIDHRVMDGLHGARFLADLKDSLETLSFLV
jgi:pyruvate dehydrogenase E2 component (dihydrolipoamide acetyltransferase)